MIRFPRKLLIRTCVIGAANVVLVFAALYLVDQARRQSRDPFMGQTLFIGAALQDVLADNVELDRVLKRIEHTWGAQVSVFAPDGRQLGTTSHGPPLPRGVEPGRERRWRPLGRVGPGLLEMVVPIGEEGEAATAVIVHEGPASHPLLDPKVLMPGILAVLSIVTAFLMARWLLQPLIELSAFARELGSGNLKVRLGPEKVSSLGSAATTFDEMADRLEALMRAQKELLANVSHELRTPLARIRVAMDLAAEGGAAEAAASLSEIGQDLVELERLVDDILVAARLELNADTAAAPRLHLDRLEAADLVADAEARFRSRHEGRTLRIDPPPPGTVLLADRMLLRRALDNLLDNAVRHSAVLSTVILGARMIPEGVAISVQDSGSGMPPRDLRRLFTPFFRADQSRDRHTGGLGLGLLLTKRIVEAHQGTIAVESAPGVGTTVRIVLPLLAAGSRGRLPAPAGHPS
jgi:two-component system OmpR family sensor kinase